MADNSLLDEHIKARQFRDHMFDIYADGTLKNVLPRVTTDPNKWEDQARQHLSTKSFNYVAGGAGERATMDANRLAFKQWKMIPRMLRRSDSRNLSVEILGQRYKTPLFFAPVGVQAIFHGDKETGIAQVGAELGIPVIQSTASTSSIEDVAKANGNGERWYQLYWPADDDITISILNRAKASGFRVLVVTLDTFSIAWRPADLDQAYLPFSMGVGNEIGFSDPVFRRKFKEKHSIDIEDNISLASSEWQTSVFGRGGRSWEELKFIKEHWDGPILLKGIQHVDDARLAVEAGMDGIIVSNHGGRQCDGAIGSLEVLPEIVQAVGAQITVLFDSGIRTGVDIIKALCLGAEGVLIGRPYVYGLSIAGKAGVKEIMQGLLADLDQSMMLSGIRNISECTRGMIRKVPYGGDLKSCN